MLAETLLPYLDTDSHGELPARLYQDVAVPQQDGNDHLTQYQKIPEEFPVLDWDQNQAPALSRPKGNNVKATDVDQDEDHQSFQILIPPLGSKSSRPTEFIVSPPNLKKDLVQHRRLAKIVIGTTGHVGKKPQDLDKQLQNGYLDSSMDVINPEENLLLDLLGSPDQPPEPFEEAEIPSSLQEAQTHHPELTEEVDSSLQQEAPAQNLQTPEKGESFLSQAEAQAQRPETTEEIELPPLQQGALSQPSEAPEEVGTSVPQAEGGLQEVLVEPLRHHKVNVPNQNEAQQSNLHDVTVNPVDLALTITPEVTNVVETSPVQQEVPSQPPESPEEVEPPPVQEEAPSQLLESPEEVEPPPAQEEALSQPPESPEYESALLHQESPSQVPGFPGENVPQFPVSDEAAAQPGSKYPAHSNPSSVTLKPVDLELTVTPEPAKEGEFTTAQQEALPQPLEYSVEAEPSPTLQDATGPPPEPPEEAEPSPGGEGQLAQPYEPNEEVVPFSNQQESPAQPTEHPEVVKPATQQESPAQSPAEIEPSATQQESTAQRPESPAEFEPSPAHSQEPDVTAASPPGQDQAQSLQQPSVTVKPVDLALTITPGPTGEAEPSPPQQEASAQSAGFPEQLEPLLVQQEAPDQPPAPSGSGEPSPVQLEPPAQPPETSTAATAQPPIHNEVTFSPAGPGEAQRPVMPGTTGEPLDLAVVITPEPAKEAESSPEQQEGSAYFPISPEQAEFSPVQSKPLSPSPEPPGKIDSFPGQQEATAQTAGPPEGVGLSSVQEEALAQPPEPPKEAEMTVGTPGQNQAQHSSSPSVTDKPLDLGLTVTPGSLTAAGHSASLQQTSHPTYMEVTPPQVEQVLAQHPSMTEFTVQPLDLEVTLSPEPNTEAQPSPAMQGTPTWPPEPHQPSLYQEVTVPTPDQDHLEHLMSSSVIDKPLDLELTVTSEPTTEAEHSTSPPPEHPEVTLSPSSITPVTVHTVDLEVTVTGASSVDVEPSPTKQETPTQPPEPPKEVVVQYPPHQVVTIATPSKGHGQHTPSSVTPHHVDLELTMTSEPAMEAQHSTVLRKTTAPSPEVALAHPDLTRVTVPPVDQEFTTTRHPGSLKTPASTEPSVVQSVTYTSEKEQPEQSAPTSVNICQLCTCSNETLSCVGLSPKERLRRVPVPERNSYNGTFTVLDFQGNSISYIDENTWKPYRWTEKLNLGCNSVTDLSFGTFRAAHGMQFLQKVILSHNPLTTVEDSYLFKLPALRYLDLGKTEVSLTTIERILMMSLELEKLILPSRRTCCLCQFKNTIEVVCKTVKLHCDRDCLTETTHCGEGAAVGNIEGLFMKVLEARKNNTSTELIIESEKASSDKHDVSFSAFVDEQLDFNDETDVISALNYVLPYFSEGNLEDLETAFLPFIKLLFLHLQDGDKPLGYLGKNTRNRFVKPKSNNLLYKNKLQTFYHLKKWAGSQMQKKIEVKKKEKTARHVHADPLGHKLWQTFQKELDTAQPQENSPAKTESVGERLQGVDWVLKDPDVIIKGSVNELKHWGKQNAQPAAENTAKEEALRRLAPGARGQLHMRRPRKLVGSSFNTKPSFINEDKAAVSSSLPPASTLPKSEVQQESKDLSYTILEDAESIVRNMEASKPTSRPRKKHMFLGPRSRAMHRAFQAERNHHLKREELLRISAGGPPSSAVRSLINPPSREAISSEEQLNSQENPLEEFSPSDPLVGKVTLPEGAMSEVAARTDIPSTYSVTAGNFMPTVEHTDETQQEYHNVGTELPSKPTGFTSPGPSSLGDQFEIQVNQQLRSIIPNDYMRSLISHMIRTLKLDCTEMHVKLSCAKFFTRTGLLIKLLSEQQKAKMSKAEGNTDLWKAENYISESTEDRSEQTRMESNELTEEVPGSSYTNKLIFTISLSVTVTAVVAVLVINFCLFEIYSHRTAAKGHKKSIRGFFQFVLRRKCPEESESQEDFWRMQPLWLRDLYRPLSATRKKNMAQKLHDESSDEEIFSRVVRAPRDGAADVVLTIEPEEPDEESETAPGSNAV